MIDIRNISKSYGKKSVLKDFSAEIDEGEIIGILGENGSGKSTLLSILYGIVSADRGNFLFGDENLFEKNKLRQKIVGYVPQGTPLIEELSAWDNLCLWYKKEDLQKSLNDGFLKTLGINEFLKLPVKKMSGGMKKRLSIGCALFNNPKILLLDEPTASLDILCKQTIYDYFREFKKSGGTIIIATHEIQEIELTDRCFIIKDGAAVEYKYSGDVDELSKKIWEKGE